MMVTSADQTNESPGNVAHHRMDIIWHYLSSMKAPDHTLRFSRLCQVAKLVMVIPHSNAQDDMQEQDLIQAKFGS